MSMNNLILTALKNIGVPVAYQTYTGKEVATWVTFFFYNEFPYEFADDEEIERFHGVQVDVWAKGNYSATVEAIMKAMKNADFRWSGSYDLYESDTKIYHKVLRFNYTNQT